MAAKNMAAKIRNTRPKLAAPQKQRCALCKNYDCEYNPTRPKNGIHMINRCMVWNIMALKGCVSFK